VTRYLKRGRAESDKQSDDSQVRTIVEGIIADVTRRGDDAVRELSVKFDKWDRESYRLSDSEIRGCIAQLSKTNLDDIRFAQQQVRNFAEHQRTSLRDIEVETLPGVVLGQEYPGQFCGLLRARRKVSVAGVGPYVRADGKSGRGCPCGDLCAAV